MFTNDVPFALVEDFVDGMLHVRQFLDQTCIVVGINVFRLCRQTVTDPQPIFIGLVNGYNATVGQKQFCTLFVDSNFTGDVLQGGLGLDPKLSRP